MNVSRPDAPGRSAARLQMLLLGSPQVLWCGKPLAIKRRQVRALLYLLAMSLQPVTREYLAFLLWADLPEAQARRNLTHLITHLRQALPDPDLLLLSDSRLALNHNLVYCDVIAMHALRDASKQGNDRVKTLQDMISLYAGPLLADLSLPESPEFEIYVREQQHALDVVYLDALKELIGILREQGRLDEAIAGARNYLATHPLSEEIHRQLIEMYGEAGDRSAALNQYQQCAALLEQELGVPPLPETVDAYRAAVLGKTVNSPGAYGKRWHIQPSLAVPMVGRESDMAQLMDAYNLARQGSGRVVLVSGETGTGKTRLLQEFTSSLAECTLVLTAACHPGTQLIPFQSVTQVLQSLLDNETISRISSPELRAEIMGLLPELNTLHAGILYPEADKSDRILARLHDVVFRLAVEVCPNTCAVVLCFDDLQWADQPTLDWLAYLAAHIENKALLVLGSYCCAATGPVIEMFHRMTRLGVLTEIPLSRLESGAVRRLVRHTCPANASDQSLVTRLTAAVGGNPYYLLEMLRVIKDDGQGPWPWIDAQGVPLPEGIMQSVRARVDRLSPVARQILEAASVLGMDFSFDKVRRTSGRQELEAMDGLEELMARCLVYETDEGFHFCHALMRRAVAQCMSQTRLRLLERRAERIRAGHRKS